MKELEYIFGQASRGKDFGHMLDDGRSLWRRFEDDAVASKKSRKERVDKN